MKHVFREHNQEADHLAYLGRPESFSKRTVEGVKNSEMWNAVRVYWDGSTKGE